MDHPTSKHVTMSTRRSWIDQLRSQPCPSFGSTAAYNYSGHNASWEEHAFAEDTLLHVWPPRSYSCAFCHREFRSAQALGGHMNVHRRDRARLRQQEQPSSPNSQAPEDRQSNLNTPPSDDCVARNRSSDNCNYYPSSGARIIVNNIDGDEVISVQKDFEVVVANLNRKRKDHCQVDQLEDQAVSKKRRCVSPSEFPLFSRSNSPIQLKQLQNEVTIKSTSCPIEELDLELRLGNCPRVI